MTWQEQTAAICHAINALRQTVGSSYHNDGGTRAVEYLTEAKVLIETAYDVLRREDRWSKKQPSQLARPAHASVH
jgi:hypothetical protein